MAELALAHNVGTKVEQAYRRGTMLEKRIHMMEDWARFCATPYVVKPSAEVIPLQSAA